MGDRFRAPVIRDTIGACVRGAGCWTDLNAAKAGTERGIRRETGPGASGSRGLAAGPRAQRHRGPDEATGEGRCFLCRYIPGTAAARSGLAAASAAISGGPAHAFPSVSFGFIRRVPASCLCSCDVSSSDHCHDGREGGGDGGGCQGQRPPAGCGAAKGATGRSWG